MTELRIKFLHPGAVMPKKMSAGSAGYDLYTAEDTVLPPSATDNRGRVNVGRVLVNVGIAVELPSDTVGRIGSRSGLSVDFNIEVGAGWIDSDYRGELVVELKNLSSNEYSVRHGDRIAQLIILPIAQTELTIAEGLKHSDRGASGFGSTGPSDDCITEP